MQIIKKKENRSVWCGTPISKSIIVENKEYLIAMLHKWFWTYDILTIFPCTAWDLPGDFCASLCWRILKIHVLSVSGNNLTNYFIKTWYKTCWKSVEFNYSCLLHIPWNCIFSVDKLLCNERETPCTTTWLGYKTLPEIKTLE